MKLCMIVGHRKSKHCGVKDYSERLAASLTELGVEAVVCAWEPWNLKSLADVLSFLTKQRFDVVHVQYPSIGYRSSLVPHILGALRTAPASLVTFHEYSALPRCQQVCAQIFRWTTKQMLFVSEFEQSCYNRNLGRIGAPQTVIPIASNVPSHPQALLRRNVVLYFGQIRPNKGLEQFIELARLEPNSNQPFQCVIAGSAPDKHQVYFERLRADAPKSIEWRVDLSFADIAELMASCAVAYLPFPDGVSSRRGSVLAAFANGLPVISTCGPATGSLEKAILVAETPEQALIHIGHILNDTHYAQSVVAKATELVAYRSWPEIALQHKSLYQRLLDGRAPSCVDLKINHSDRHF
ncbi:MAG TPA: glycosyltransferase [Bryobacteraceae bacterium]|jgi:glycosyltransferase involved in cell wall biosynthesis|nr:glycosyltransferase [Bryobacteraceae bacterium]